ncbi:hypothetical protein [Leptospira stimsonii]|uniref:Lipoprotein n=1 Tax=Leptospira stimsonii TaxID=2202203 RepID=A0ABY2MVR4_9LEPT|nr:hypothetical protein [Leptospira stimsonii]TGK23664.1 hypothetical protein EHO98_04855 [Leptospira stimsonii]TGM09782.1 hypothetical protein EHQ90_20550 [Leptospira stimsonii]
MKFNQHLSILLGFVFLILANCKTFSHYEANYLAEGKEINGSKILMILPSYSDHITEDVYHTPFLENQRKNALGKPKTGGIVEITVDPRKQFQDSPARKSFKMFLEGSLYSSLKSAISTANPSVQYFEEKDEKRLAPEIQKTFKNPFVPLSPVLREELKKKNIEYVLVPFAYSSPGNELFTKTISVQQNNNNKNGGGTTTETKSTASLEAGAIVGVRLQLIEVQSGESEKISSIFIPWNYVDNAKPNFQESVLKLVQGIFPPKS